MTTTEKYTSKATWEDYDNAKAKTLRGMERPKETTRMEQVGNTVYYFKHTDDMASENNSNRHWYECYSRRVQTLIDRDTGEVVETTTYEDIEYYGTATDYKSVYVHKITRDRKDE